MDRNEFISSAPGTSDSGRKSTSTDRHPGKTRHRVHSPATDTQSNSRRGVPLHHSGHLAPGLKYPNLYFAYGSNLNHDQMAWRCPTARFVKRFDLRGWRLAFGHHATIVPQRGAAVPGALWLVQPQDFLALDRYEGYPTYYTRRRWRQDHEHFFFYEIAGEVSGYPSAGYIQGIQEGYDDCGIIEDKWHQSLTQNLQLSVQSRYDYI